MRKFISLLLALMMALSLCACGGTSTVEPSTPSLEDPSKPEQGSEVVVTVCPFAAGGKTDEELQALIEENGYTSFVRNENGSVSFTMTEEKRAEKEQEYLEQIDFCSDTIMSYATPGGNFDSIEDVEVVDNGTTIRVLLNEESASAFVKLAMLPYKSSCAWYQALQGVEPEDVSLVAEFYYGDSAEPIDVMAFSDFMEVPEESEDEGDPSEDNGEDVISSRPIADGDTITIDDYCEFTVVGWDHVDEITKDGMLMITGSKGENDTIFRLTIKYTNLTATEQDTGSIADGDENEFLKRAVLTYDDKYIYEGGSGCWGDLLPLSEQEVYIIFNVPKTIFESDAPIVLDFQIGDQAFTYTAR